MRKSKPKKEVAASVDPEPELFPIPHEISDSPVTEAREIIKYSLIYPLRKHNNVAEIIVHPYPNEQLHKVLKEPCDHECISSWKCEACEQRFFNFRNFLDFGRHTKFITISRDEVSPFFFRTRVYSAYHPNDVVELREYMMLILSNSLGLIDRSFRIESPRLSRKMSYYLTTRYDNWAFYSHRCLPGKILKFNAMFESGNLEAAEMVDLDHYQLTISPDTNTLDYARWFYFSVSNTTVGKVASFKILNLISKTVLYTKGMRIWVYSREKHQQKGVGWHLGGTDIFYYENQYMRRTGGKNYFTLAFKYAFEYTDDEVYFAYSHPYIYTRTCYMIQKIEERLMQKREAELSAYRNKYVKLAEIPTLAGTPYPPFVLNRPFNLGEEDKRLNTEKISYTRKTFARTLCGLPTFVLEITGDRKKGILPPGGRKCVIITARVHPGDTSSSYTVEGFLSFILSDNVKARVLRDLYVFKVFVGLNPDGVVVGNSRTGVEGADLAQQWQGPRPKTHSTIFGALKIVRSAAEKRGILMFCDLRSHHSKRGSLLYGCPLPSVCTFSAWSRIRLPPRVLAKLTLLFGKEDCIFNIGLRKSSTARAVINALFKVANSFTLKCSVHGYVKRKNEEDEDSEAKDNKREEGKPPEFLSAKAYKTSDYALLGEKLCESMFDFAGLQHSVERIEWLANGKLPLEKQMELAKIIAQETTRRFISQVKAHRSGISGFVEQIWGRERGRSVSPPRHNSAMNESLKKLIIILPHQRERSRTLHRTSLRNIHTRPSELESPIHGLDSVDYQCQDQDDILEELLRDYKQRVEIVNASAADSDSDSEFEGNVESLRNEYRTMLHSRSENRNIRRGVSYSTLSRRGEPTQSAIDETDGLIKNQRSLKELLKISIRRKQKHLAGALLNSSTGFRPRTRPLTKLPTKPQPSHYHSTGESRKMLQQTSPGAKTEAALTIQKLLTCSRTRANPFASVIKQVSCVFKGPAMVIRKGTGMSESRKEQEEHIRKTLMMKQSRDKTRSISVRFCRTYLSPPNNEAKPVVQ